MTAGEILICVAYGLVLYGVIRLGWWLGGRR